MTIELGLTDELCNTRYAVLAALCAHYQQNQVLAPLAEVQIPQRKRDFCPSDKLIQVFLSVLAGCETLSEVNTYLKSESDLAAIWGWDRVDVGLNSSRYAAPAAYAENLVFLEETLQQEAKELLDFLCEWLKNHILVSDKAFGNFLVNKTD